MNPALKIGSDTPLRAVPDVDSALGATARRTQSHQRPSRANPAESIEASRQQPDDTRIAKLEALLMLEAEARAARTLRELIFCIANETQKCVPARQTYVLSSGTKNRGLLKIEAVSNLSTIDRNAPVVRWLELAFSGALADADKRDADNRLAPFKFVVPAPKDEKTAQFAFRHGLLVPLTDLRGRVFAAIILVNENPFEAGSQLVLNRLRDAYRHSWLALSPRPHGRLRWLLGKRVVMAGAALLTLALFIPVPLTTLAPVEVVAQQPYIVAAPNNGVISSVLVEPNTFVKKGAELFKYVDTDLAARYAIAEQNRNVARARLQTVQQNSFKAPAGRRDLAISKAELELAETELVYAGDQLAKTRMLAPRDGLVVFDRKTDWQGKPVTTGERVIQIAAPAFVEYRVDLPISDVIVLEEGARAKNFLDSNPLSPRESRVTSAGYRASMSASDQLVYQVYASAVDDGEHVVPRIGARGTAQIFGETVSLGFYLFRRPLSAIRQWLGW